MLTRIVRAVLTTENLVVPNDDQRSKEDFDSSAVLWGSYRAYPDQVLSALKDWVVSVEANQVDGEAIDLIILICRSILTRVTRSAMRITRPMSRSVLIRNLALMLP